MRKNLQSNSLKSIHFDATYKCVPPTPKKLRLLVVSCFDELINKTRICAFILLMDEKEDTFLEIFKVLREEPFHMNPVYLMSDLALGQFKAAIKIFPNVLYNGCFFCWSQYIWKKFQELGLGGKSTYKNNITLLFNLQILCFTSPTKIKLLYKKIKNKFDTNSATEKFFKYFSNNWFGNRYPIKIWNYYDRLNMASENSITKYITTYNLNENINKFLNFNLKGGKNSFESFVNAIKRVYLQLEEKLQNKHKDETKTKKLNFYVKLM